MNLYVDRVKLFCESLSSVAAAASPGVKAKSPHLYGLTGNKLSPKLLLEWSALWLADKQTPEV